MITTQTQIEIGNPLLPFITTFKNSLFIAIFF